MKINGKPFMAFGGSYPRQSSALYYSPYLIRALYRNLIINGKHMIREPKYRYRLYRCWGNNETRS